MRRRIAALGLALTLPTTAILASALQSGAGAASATCADLADPWSHHGDVDGDGFADVVAGAPGTAVSGNDGAGSVVVRSGTADGPGTGTSVTLTQGSGGVPGSPEAGDGFGSAVAVGFVDGDTCADVVIGAPGEDTGAGKDTGLAVVVFGNEAGLGAGRAPLTLQLGSAGIPGSPAEFDKFGSALAVDAQDSPDLAALAIGIPGRDVSGENAAGAVAVLGLATADGCLRPQLLTQASAGVPGNPQDGDHFGAAVVIGGYGPLFVGTPGEASDAGAVVAVNHWRTAGPYTGTLWSEATTGIAGTAEKGDLFGNALAYAEDAATATSHLAIGVPGEDVGTDKDAGAVHLFDFPGDLIDTAHTRDTALNQDSGGVPGTAEAGDRFGAAVLLSDYATTASPLGFALLVGAPDEGVGTATAAGAVTRIDAADPHGPGTALSKSSDQVPGEPAAGEHLGSSLLDAGSGGSGGALLGVPDDAAQPSGSVVRAPWELLEGGEGTATAWTPAGGTRFGRSLAGGAD